MSSTLVVMQPTFLPWAGFFNLIAKSDIFVFYDDVQLEKRSWQTRNRLLLEGKPNWISVPIVHSGLQQRIFDTHVLLTDNWISNTYKIFARNYATHKYYLEALQILDHYIKNNSDNLARRNESTIKFISNRLNLDKNFYYSNELNVYGKRSDRLIEICKYFKADTYLSPIGALEYLVNDRFAERSPSKLKFQNFTASIYAQKNSKEFVPNLSIVDVIANLGWEKTRTYIMG